MIMMISMLGNVPKSYLLKDLVKKNMFVCILPVQKAEPIFVDVKQKEKLPIIDHPQASSCMFIAHQKILLSILV